MTHIGYWDLIMIQSDSIWIDNVWNELFEKVPYIPKQKLPQKTIESGPAWVYKTRVIKNLVLHDETGTPDGWGNEKEDMGNRKGWGKERDGK